MLLTTEPNLSGKRYEVIRIIFGTHRSKNNTQQAVEYALAALEKAAISLGADGVIGVHLSTSAINDGNFAINAVVMGTAIKFL